MTVQRMIIPQAEADQGFSLLKDIVDMVKNPKAIDEAYERRRKAAELTNDEVAKSEEARALITQGDALREELRKREDAIVTGREQLDKDIANHAAAVQADNERLKRFADALNEQQALQADVDKKHSQEADALAARAKQIEADHADWMKRHDDRLKSISDTETAQKAEQQSLNELRLKLLAKAKRLAAEAEMDA